LQGDDQGSSWDTVPGDPTKSVCAPEAAVQGAVRAATNSQPSSFPTWAIAVSAVGGALVLAAILIIAVVAVHRSRMNVGRASTRASLLENEHLVV